MDTKQVDRDCNTCAYHKQGEHPPDMCIDCLAVSSQTTTYLPFWLNTYKGEPVSKSFDAAFRTEGSMLDRRVTKSNTSSSVVDTAVMPMTIGDLTNKVIKSKSDGSTADYYELPVGATQLQDLISHKNMNAQIGEIFRACYRMGQASHSPNLRDAKKILFYAQAEVKRLGG